MKKNWSNRPSLNGKWRRIGPSGFFRRENEEFVYWAYSERETKKNCFLPGLLWAGPENKIHCSPRKAIGRPEPENEISHDSCALQEMVFSGMDLRETGLQPFQTKNKEGLVYQASEGKMKNWFTEPVLNGKWKRIALYHAILGPEKKTSWCPRKALQERHLVAQSQKDEISHDNSALQEMLFSPVLLKAF